MRRKYLVSYDITDQKRLGQIYKKMKGYGDALQYSVFICDLSDKEKIIMISELSHILNHSEDSVLIFDLGNSSSKYQDKIMSIGKVKKFEDRGAIII
ncbi:CRISPR-associated endonuclease Cas2 [Cuniculiplasma divulgatum]|jgi:CRISPR-associated protein Cas2|uniref:CRISPR-associated endoribonuclease Cas2 n=1 Tax=Cuniculiplasma divulgatum TaxID=1673428 RepID=A0A1N5W375_9ARCH|nr:CRISPR-associated endonuclease Cas2 [Cuniculiplasma divulgatum]EQB68021.1 MAG: CRISPR-associated protein Cas2 [Thermoplasmatales archaeon Gpl]SIM79674.1 CRISPR-associated protein Cas2 [Cuniculiplasma divulgatum]HIH60468.1 CRISPR-associated endonuclease Cas2 [Ferroplasma sp.]